MEQHKVHIHKVDSCEDSLLNDSRDIVYSILDSIINSVTAPSSALSNTAFANIPQLQNSESDVPIVANLLNDMLDFVTFPPTSTTNDEVLTANHCDSDAADTRNYFDKQITVPLLVGQHDIKPEKPGAIDPKPDLHNFYQYDQQNLCEKISNDVHRKHKTEIRTPKIVVGSLDDSGVAVSMKRRCIEEIVLPVEPVSSNGSDSDLDSAKGWASDKIVAREENAEKSGWDVAICDDKALIKVSSDKRGATCQPKNCFAEDSEDNADNGDPSISSQVSNALDKPETYIVADKRTEYLKKLTSSDSSFEGSSAKESLLLECKDVATQFDAVIDAKNVNDSYLCTKIHGDCCDATVTQRELHQNSSTNANLGSCPSLVQVLNKSVNSPEEVNTNSGPVSLVSGGNGSVSKLTEDTTALLAKTISNPIEVFPIISNNGTPSHNPYTYNTLAQSTTGLLWNLLNYDVVVNNLLLVFDTLLQYIEEIMDAIKLYCQSPNSEVVEEQLIVNMLGSFTNIVTSPHVRARLFDVWSEDYVSSLVHHLSDLLSVKTTTQLSDKLTCLALLLLSNLSIDRYGYQSTHSCDELKQTLTGLLEGGTHRDSCLLAGELYCKLWGSYEPPAKQRKLNSIRETDSENLHSNEL